MTPRPPTNLLPTNPPPTKPSPVDQVAPLLVSADPLLVAEVQRLAAAAGVAPDVVADPAVALGRWSAAPVVLVGTDSAALLSSVGPPRRARVHVLGRAPVGDTVFRDALGVGAEAVATLPASETWLVELLTDVGDGAAAPGVSIGVVGGSGGAGATVFAAAVAQTSSRTTRTLLMDTDPLGAGADRVLGLEGEQGVRWDSLGRSSGRLSSRSLREALPRQGLLSVLSWPVDRAAPLEAYAVREALSAGCRGFEVVVVDLPRHLDPVVTETLSRCDHVVVVVAPTVPGVASASRLVRHLPGGPRRHLVTRGGPGGVDPDSVSQLLEMPLLVAMPDQRHLDEAIDLGAGPARHRRGPLARAARRVVDGLVGAA
jgi:secretion/DNA translocation related CpaE-like protein